MLQKNTCISKTEAPPLGSELHALALQSRSYSSACLQNYLPTELPTYLPTYRTTYLPSLWICALVNKKKTQIQLRRPLFHPRTVLAESRSQWLHDAHCSRPSHDQRAEGKQQPCLDRRRGLWRRLFGDLPVTVSDIRCLLEHTSIPRPSAECTCACK